MAAANLFSIDLEDWFHLLDTESAPGPSRWAGMESRVEANTETLLEELERHGVRCTFFTLGWVAEAYPQLLRTIVEQGHEVANHGYAHRLVYEQTPQQFRDDLRRAADSIAKIAGEAPQGYRAPGFSVTEQSRWALDVLAEEGYRYDSSVFPARRGHGGLPGAGTLPSRLPNGMLEFPISTVNLGIGRLAYLGGGYLRLLPKSLVLRWARAQQRDGQPLVLYLHPRDIDAAQPRLPLSPVRRFRSYVGLAGCLKKISTLLQSFDWIPYREYPDEAPAGRVATSEGR